MKFLGCFLGLMALLVIAGGAIAISMNASDSNEPETGIVATPTLGTPDPLATDTSDPENLAPPGEGTSAEPTTNNSTPELGNEATATAIVQDVNVAAPSLEVPTFPLASVQATFTEAHEFGLVTVKFRPGAYSPEYAAHIADLTNAAIAEANAKLQTSWSEDLTIFLADQLFAEDCLGCQGFTESDFRWIFMLDDGSVTPDEFEALLVHEMTHMIAGNEIHLPLDIFYVEGLAMWVMTDDLMSYGYVPPLQTTAWVYSAGSLPSLETIVEDDFAGRMRKRIYYDAAGAFAFYVIETYGWDAYISLYRQNPIELVLGKPLPEIEAEWHAYLQPHTSATINGVGADEWWIASEQVIAAFGRFYEDPSLVSAEQYRLLTLSRLALNRADTGNALAFLEQSGV